MKNPIIRLRSFVEYQAFGVCTKLGEKMGIASGKIRLWFIYISFLTLGSPLIIYMIMAFILNMRQYIWLRRRNPLRA
ncbi:PspC domain-containing protein [Edaphocola flava]|jgi:phage shock protein PspC (stress-responsive transcriptional regulator)|uniref:PspC domain-containing protein n=1 Tax=Edaphocola flava TaxID=2499629 RepID=UPI001F3E362D|nr:PspC domain-containing protein [Edaphocola flava]